MTDKKDPVFTHEPVARDLLEDPRDSDFAALTVAMLFSKTRTSKGSNYEAQPT